MDTGLKFDDGINIVLVNNDDAFNADVLSYLEKNGFNIIEASSSVELDQILNQTDVQIVILDTMAPGEGGLSVCRRLVQEGQPAVILVSAAANEIDRIIGLELGADDCIAKPFNPRELLARIKAILRRRGGDVGPVLRTTKGGYKFSGFAFDIAHRELKAPDGEIILLTEREFSLLRAFLANPKTVLSRDKLIEQSYGAESGTNDRAIDVQVSRLRRKLEACCNETIIKTHRGAGYMLTCEVFRT
jgi:two-component system OmpR family response regulator